MLKQFYPSISKARGRERDRQTDTERGRKGGGDWADIETGIQEENNYMYRSA